MTARLTAPVRVTLNPELSAINSIVPAIIESNHIISYNHDPMQGRRNGGEAGGGGGGEFPHPNRIKR